MECGDKERYSLVLNGRSHALRRQCGANRYYAQNADFTLIEKRNGEGLAAIYYDNLDFTGVSMRRFDAPINFDWGSGSPDPGIGGDPFSARWARPPAGAAHAPYNSCGARGGGLEPGRRLGGRGVGAATRLGPARGYGAGGVRR